MIECSNEYIYYKNKKKIKKSKKKIKVFFLIFLLFLSVFTYYKLVIEKQIFNICTEYTNQTCTWAVNDAVSQCVSDDLKYTHLINVEKNNNGDVILMSANSLNINKISRDIINKTEEIVFDKIDDGVPVPFLVFLSGALSGYGKTINFKNITISSVNCEFESKFNSVGINQTLHSIYVNVQISSQINAFFMTKTITCQTPVLISETILIGKVPDTYLNGKLFS